MTVAAAKVENTEERKDTMEKVEETRKHQTEAAIVRIMKQRKTLDHNNLIAEVTAQLSSRFTPVPNMIKARIEALIEREYLERDENNMKVYNYLVLSTLCRMRANRIGMTSKDIMGWISIHSVYCPGITY